MMKEKEKRKYKKKRDQSIVERELQSFLYFYIKQFIEEAINDVFKDFP